MKYYLSSGKAPHRRLGLSKSELSLASDARFRFLHAHISSVLRCRRCYSLFRLGREFVQLKFQLKENAFYVCAVAMFVGDFVLLLVAAKGLFPFPSRRTIRSRCDAVRPQHVHSQVSSLGESEHFSSRPPTHRELRAGSRPRCDLLEDQQG